MALERVLVLYNTDYDDELIAASPADVSAVKEAAVAVCGAVAACGYQAELIGVAGHDVGEVFERVRSYRPDLVFNLVESLAGDTRNEVVIPALMDLLGVAYTGPGPFTIGMCLHKDRSKQALVAGGIPTPDHITLIKESDFERADVIEYPTFVKLVREDASIGIDESNVARDRAGLEKRARELWAKYHQGVIAERYIEGREVNVTVVGNDGDLECLPLHEIDFTRMPPGRPRIVSYAAKWDESHVDYAGTVPVPMKNVSAELAEAIESTSKRAFAALGLRDFGRVDLRVDADGQPWVIDVNPNCDISPDAGVARAARAAGIDFPRLIGRICETAWRRRADSNPSAETE